MELAFEAAPLDPARRALEVVERKGAGHPDTLCDRAAEAFSRRLAQYYLEHAGSIAHHNVDKALLVAGETRARPGGGEWLAPIALHLAGRAVAELRDGPVPVDALGHAAAQEVLGTVRRLEPDRVETHVHVRAASADLRALYERGRGAVPLSNDTSIGVGFWPMTPTERATLAIERRLAELAACDAIPALGEDVKVMLVRRAATLQVTVAAAMIASRVSDEAAYRAAVEAVADEARTVAERHGFGQAHVAVNAADAPGAPYVTLSGTSAEAGDDGQVGRGNRFSGLITPMRPMTLEAVAGKNPVSHVGKLLSIAATGLAERCAAHEGVRAAECILVSRIGAPITEPQAAGVRVDAPSELVRALEPELERWVARSVAELPGLWRELVRDDAPPPA